MSDQQIGWTVRALHAGQLSAGALLVAAIGLRLLGHTGAAAWLALAGVVALTLTPALGLVATHLELRRSQPAAAMLAAGVLVILAASVAVAILQA